jgi:hypothetical protein
MLPPRLTIKSYTVMIEECRTKRVQRYFQSMKEDRQQLFAKNRWVQGLLVVPCTLSLE